ncbi:histidine phosphatase family protein [Pseudomonas stutzeri]|uniref:Histidine phosphatase family protein n=1 Tax=Stutzerimonas stutzeri TaxID=316 RepID=A0A2N8S7N6_STUST|nr:histidine phosphatase family protein [Stutzerimonas stutzeri]MCQ4294954.1 histidine phosphatase family protein [Stutzerimonas stutzeri]PNF82632.1 histidine phosphatase family protein [Stutzerimonas stutzeri]
MCRAGLLICLLYSLELAQADEHDAWQALREGHAILVLRHATAPGLGDPGGFNIDDCKTQRNLDERGRAEARRWGARLRQAGITSARVLSSRWCRALETAQFMALGVVEPLPALDSFFTSPITERHQTAALRRAVEVLAPGEVAVLVTHQVNITALTGIFPQSGEGLILARPLAVPPVVLARIAPP